MIVRTSGFDTLERKFKAAPPLVSAWKQKELENAREKIKAMAKAKAPVLSGALRDSIEGETSQDTTTVYSDLFYAAFREFGTYKMAPAPFLIPSAMQYMVTLPASFLFMVKKVFW